MVYATRGYPAILTAPQENAAADIMPYQIASGIVPSGVTEHAHPFVEIHRHVGCYRGRLFMTDAHLIHTAADATKDAAKLTAVGFH